MMKSRPKEREEEDNETIIISFSDGGCEHCLCLEESKDGSSLSDEIAQDSKSLRCTKSLYAYNSSLRNKLMWSMNWSGKAIHETTMIH